MTDRFRDAIARGPLLLDAALGTRLVALGLDLGADDPCLWNLARPEEVAAIHRRDVGAGAEAVVSNTFGANRHWLARFGRGRDVAAINGRAVALAREVAGPGRFVLGSIGPTASEDPGAVREQADSLLEAGADALLFETHRAAQGERALEALGHALPVPVIVSLFLWPDPLAGAVRRLEDRGATALGVNCQLGMAAARRSAEALRRVTPLPLLVKPSAGLPGEIPEAPESFAREVPALLALGPVLIGGCCGTTEAHVAALRASCYDGPVTPLRDDPARRPPVSERPEGRRS